MSKKSRGSKTSESADSGTAVAEPRRSASAVRREARRQAVVKSTGPQFDFKGFLISALIVLVVVGAIYGRTAGYSFVSWDDDVHVYENPHLTNPDGPETGFFWGKDYKNLYIPVTYTVWSIVASGARVPFKAGQPPFDPTAFHITSITLHVINSLLVLLLIRLLLTRGRAAEKIPESAVTPAALIGALAFAVHPLTVESVVWISETKGLLAAMFSMTALICYVQYAHLSEKSKDGDMSPWAWFAGASVAFVLAVLSKPNAVTLPLVAFALDFWWIGRPVNRTVPLGAWLLVSVISVAGTSGVQPVHSTDTLIPALWQRPIVAGDALTFYLYKLFVPIHLNFDYGRTPFFVLAHSWVYATAAVPVLVAIALWFSPRAMKAGGAIFAVALLPVLGLVPFIYQVYSTVADRYAYISLLGVALILAWIAGRKPGPAVWAVCGVLIVGWAVLTFNQSTVWTNSLTLYQHGVKENPNAWGAYGNLATVLEAKGSTYKAEADESKTKGKLDEAESYMRMANVKFDQAEADYRRAIAIEEARPAYLEPRPESYNGLGALTALDRNHPAEAIPLYDRAIAILPGYPEAHMNRGVALEMIGRHDEAIKEVTTATEDRPTFAQAEYVLGAMYGNHGDTADAQVHFQKAVDLEPDNDTYKAALDQSQKTQPQATQPSLLPGIR